MRYTQRLLLLSLLVLGGILLLNSTSQHAFAAHYNVKTHRILLSDPNNYVQGYMAGYQSGYGQGLESCTLQNIQTTPTYAFAASYSQDPNPPTRYENGETTGYSRGYAKGQEDCQAQLQSSQSPTQQPQTTSPSPSWYYSY